METTGYTSGDLQIDNRDPLLITLTNTQRDIQAITALADRIGRGK